MQIENSFYLDKDPTHSHRQRRTGLNCKSESYTWPRTRTLLHQTASQGVFTQPEKQGHAAFAVFQIDVCSTLSCKKKKQHGSIKVTYNKLLHKRSKKKKGITHSHSHNQFVSHSFLLISWLFTVIYFKLFWACRSLPRILTLITRHSTITTDQRVRYIHLTFSSMFWFGLLLTN